MEQRIVKLQIANEYIVGAGVPVGAVGSHDDVLLEMDFRSSALWAGTTRRAIFADALGVPVTPIILTTNLLEEGQSDVYLVPVPAEAKDVAGECFLTVEGFIADGEKEILRIVTEETTFRVLPSKLYTNDNPSLTPSEAEQLQKEIDDLYPTIQEQLAEAKRAEAAAKESEGKAKASEEEAARTAASIQEATAQDAQFAAQKAGEAAQSAFSAHEASGSAHGAAAAAQAAQRAAEEAAERAEAISGGDVPTRTEAQGYANTAEQNAKEYAADQDATTLNSAKTYAQEQDTETLNSAKDYTNEKIAEIPRPQYVEATMLATGWVDGKYSFEDTYPHAQYDIEVSVADTATEEQFEAAGAAYIGSSATSNVFTARGEVPTVDIPVIVEVKMK